MKLKFVDDVVVQKGAGRKARYNWAEVIEELYKNPMKWAECPFQVVNASSAYSITTRYEGIEVACSGGNNKPEGHPEGRLWTVYLRYVPKGE